MRYLLERGEEILVCKLSINSYGNVLDFAKEWVSYGNKQYSEIDRWRDR